MLLGIKQSYESVLTAEQVMAVVDELGKRETGFFFKGAEYQVEATADSFTLRKQRSTPNSPVPPLILGQLRGGWPVQVDVEIRPHWSGLLVLAFVLIVTGIMAMGILTADKMTVNGVRRAVEPGERALWMLFPLGVGAFLGYFKVLRPIATTEKWLRRELRLQRIE